ncbi:PfkB family carbohydrate kinase [Ruania zhangjianzhongii]|uniref:PfkB family carbohydrate kinase n=1 Tax=Ruania zhangjianzhongii TaxID=2603206 RepID=UPI0016523EE3|nr:PfkB family carbohydrate kinase [Ruania zhangjianzhongii]
MPTAGVAWFIGLTTLDVVHRASAPPSANEKVTASRQDVAAGGPAANAAVVARALGIGAHLISALGGSPMAAAARADLEAAGVQVVDIAPEHELAVSAILVDEGTGARSVTSTDGGAADPAPPDFSGSPDPAVVLIDGHYPRLAVAAARAARERGALVVLDAGRWRPVFAELIGLADLVAASADFALPDGGRGPGALVAAGAGAGVVTAGSGPVRYATGTEHGEIAVPAVPVADTLAAGDAFHGGLVAGLVTRRLRAPGPGASLPAAPLRRALDYAVAVASHRVQHVGPRSYLETLPRR